MRYNSRLLVAIAVTAVALLVVFSQLNIAAIVSAITQVKFGAAALASLLLLIGAFLAVMRLWFIANDIGHRLSIRDTMLALGLGQLAGAATIQFFGQIAARTALLSNRGLTTPTNIAIAAYERLIAVGISLLLASAGGWYLFGQFALDIKGGGGTLLYLIAGILVAFGAGAYFVWGETAFAGFREHLNDKTVASLTRTAFITFLIQLTTSAAYVVIAVSLAPDVSIGAIFAASLVVMFAASLPISFAGWGIRELSAAVALTAVGMQATEAVAVAALVGILALVSIIIVAATAALMPPADSHVAATGSQAGEVSMEALVKWVLPLTAATAVLFQVHVPTATRSINVNLADPIVILGAAVFLIYRVFKRRTQWRLQHLNICVVLATLAILLAWTNGYFRFGFNDWAFTNKGIGWFVLLAYGATGAMIVHRFGKQGLLWLTQTFGFAATAITTLGIVMAMASIIRGPFQIEVFSLPLSGFSQNRNAFAFLLLLAIATAPLQADRYRPWMLGILSFGIILTGSRAGFAAMAVVLVITAFTKLIRIPDLARAAATAAALFLIMSAPPSLAKISFGGAAGAPAAGAPAAGAPQVINLSALQVGNTGTGSDAERLTSWMGAIRLFKEHPIAGAGLGAYVAEQRDNPKSTVHIIHSTALWLLAEFGLVGFLIFAVPAIRLVLQEGRHMSLDAVSGFITLMLITFAVMSIAHEVLYQRAFWLLLGAGLAYVPAANRS